MQPDWAERAAALEHEDRLIEAEAVIRDAVPHEGFAISIAEMYRKRMVRLNTAPATSRPPQKRGKRRRIGLIFTLRRQPAAVRARRCPPSAMSSSGRFELGFQELHALRRNVLGICRQDPARCTPRRQFPESKTQNFQSPANRHSPPCEWRRTEPSTPHARTLESRDHSHKCARAQCARRPP